MTKRDEVYKCEVCGNIVEMVHASTGVLVCCSQSMKLQIENSVDAALEKHVPVFEVEDDKIIVEVGKVAHPMSVEHYIEWIEIVTENKIYKKYLKAGDKPRAEFIVPTNEQVLKIRTYCNLHGLWTTKRHLKGE